MLPCIFEVSKPFPSCWKLILKYKVLVHNLLYRNKVWFAVQWPCKIRKLYTDLLRNKSNSNSEMIIKLTAAHAWFQWLRHNKDLTCIGRWLWLSGIKKYYTKEEIFLKLVAWIVKSQSYFYSNIVIYIIYNIYTMILLIWGQTIKFTETVKINDPA